MKKGIFAILFLCMALAASVQKFTVHDVLLQIQRAYKVHFASPHDANRQTVLDVQ